MNKKINIIMRCILLYILGACIPPIISNAQVISATNAYSSGGTTPAIHICQNCNNSTAIGNLNADMFEIEPLNIVGSYNNEMIYGLTWGDGAGYDFAKAQNVTDEAWFWINTTMGTGALYNELPAPGTGLNNTTNGKVPAHDPDITIGNYTQPGTGVIAYFAIVVYEAGGDIYFESYDLGFNPFTSVTGPHQPVLFLLVPPYISGGQMLLSSGNGNAFRPRVDIITDNSLTGGTVEYVKYVVSWQEDDGNGTIEVWNADGTLFNTPVLKTVVADGAFPDIAGVANIDVAHSGTSFDDDMVYTTYIDGTTGDIMLAERKWNDVTVTTHTLESSLDADWPRIAAPVKYDFSNTSNSELVAAVVAQVEKTSPVNHKAVKSYSYYDPAGTPTVQPEEISEYSAAGPTFSNASPGNSTNTTYNTILPVITGTGDIVKNAVKTAGGTAFDEYVIKFYSDMTWDNVGDSVLPGGDGDYYASNLNATLYRPDGTPHNFGDFFEVNYEDLGASSSYTGDPSYFAAATSNNSNYDLLCGYWDGDYIRYKFTGGAAYTFKPGKETGVANANVNGYKAYPNPVSSTLNILNASGARYIITDMTGRIVNSGTFNSNKTQLDVSAQPSGIYMMQLSKDGSTENLKFVKQ